MLYVSDSRLEGWLSVPNKQNIKRHGWRRQYVVVSSRKIIFYNSENDKQNSDPILILDLTWVLLFDCQRQSIMWPYFLCWFYILLKLITLNWYEVFFMEWRAENSETFFVCLNLQLVMKFMYVNKWLKARVTNVKFLVILQETSMIKSNRR